MSDKNIGLFHDIQIEMCYKVLHVCTGTFVMLFGPYHSLKRSHLNILPIIGCLKTFHFR